MSDVCIIGAGIHPFGRTEGLSGRQQAALAVRMALADAGVTFDELQFAFGGSRDGGKADTLVGELGMTGLPFINVANGCATGGSAIAAAHLAISGGRWELGLVVGFDKHPRGSFAPDPAAYGLEPWYGEAGLMVGPQFFAMKIRRYLHEHGLSEDLLTLVAEKAFRNGALNPNAWRREPVPPEVIDGSPLIADPLRKYMFCSPSEGAVAFVLAAAPEARRRGGDPVHLRAVSLSSRRPGAFEVWSPDLARDIAPSPSVYAAREALEMAGVEPADLDVVQLQDTDSGAELIHMAEVGLCGHGEQEALLRAGETAIDGRIPVNTDGGCLANGEPIGASGLRQVHEIVLQLRGRAGARQVPGRPTVGFTHVYGAPGVSACTVLQR